MAKAKKAKSSKRSKKAAKLPGKTIAHHGFESRKFRCYGKRVRSGKSAKTTPRIFCAKSE